MALYRKNPGLRRLKGRGGFTLPEALVTAFIFAIIVGASTTLLLSGMDSWQVNEVKIELQQELRKGMDWIAKDLRQAGSASITNVPPDGNIYTSIIFAVAIDPVGGVITWSPNIQYVVNNGQLQRIQGGNTRVIAQNIQLLQFQRQNTTSNLVEVTLQAQKNSIRGHPLADTLNFQVKLRN
jgi:Tfp pilus assembly protein PilV